MRSAPHCVLRSRDREKGPRPEVHTHIITFAKHLLQTMGICACYLRIRTHCVHIRTYFMRVYASAPFGLNSWVFLFVFLSLCSPRSLSGLLPETTTARPATRHPSFSAIVEAKALHCCTSLTTTARSLRSTHDPMVYYS